MIVKLLTEHHLEFLSLTGGCIGWSESTLVKMPHCWKSHVMAQFKIAKTVSNAKSSINLPGLQYPHRQLIQSTCLHFYNFKVLTAFSFALQNL